MRSATLYALLMALLLAPAAGWAAVPATALLRAPEVALGSPTRLPKWRRVLESLDQEEAALRACLADARACEGARERAWRQTVRATSGLPLGQQLEAINRFVNASPYRSDSELWGASDYWATPREFLARSGDCEDYAIAKYATLRLLGIPEGAMRLVVLHDTRRNFVHAVLVVADGPRRWVLDNLSDRVLPEETLPHYRPYYSVNAEGLWRPATPGRGLVLDERDLRPARR
ncbi:hypothetical protein HRbin40_00638 [bacterium HR40]|nr:hypothetical protein HRbin40_00638 [bacterium HR40]